MFKKVLLLAAASAAMMITTGPKAQAFPDAVKPGDTFNIDVEGFNTTTGDAYYLSSTAAGYFTATFGTTVTFTGAGFDGQNCTVTSSEAIGATTTTDTFTISTPTNFINEATINGETINGLYFDIGTETGGTDDVSVILPISGTPTAKGNLLYGTSNTSFALTGVVDLGAGNNSYSGYEGVNTGTSAASTLAIHSFTYSITYATAAPEPSEYAAFGLGILCLGGLALKARRRSVAA